MLVRFKRPAFLGGTLYPVSKYGVDVPNEFREVLPSGAEVLGDDAPAAPPPKPPKPVALSQLNKKAERNFPNLSTATPEDDD